MTDAVTKTNCILRNKNTNMKRIIIILLGLFSVAYSFGQGSPTGAKTHFKNGVAVGSKDSSSFTANDSLFLTIDRNNKLMWRGNGSSAVWRVVAQVGGNDFIRNQLGSNLSAQTGKAKLSDSMWAGNIVSDNHLTSQVGVVNLKQFQSTTIPTDGYTAVYAPNKDTIQLNYGQSSSTSREVYLSVDHFPSNGGYTYQWPIGSGRLALTSNVTDSSAALRASINTKLNISDTASMLGNYLRKTDTASMLSGYARSGQYVPYTGATTNVNLGSNTLTAGGATLTGALSGTNVVLSGNLTATTLNISGASTLTGGFTAGASTFTGAVDGTALNLSGNISQTGTDARHTGGTSTGRLLIGNSTPSTYASFYGASHATKPNVIELTNDNITSISLSNTGTLTALPTYSTTVGATNRDLFIDNTGLIGYVPSVLRSKKNIENIGSTSWLHQLRPIKFNYRVKKDGKYTDSTYQEKDYGLIAEEVEPINKELVFYDVDSTGKKDLAGVKYSQLIIPMLKEAQDQKKKIDEQQKMITAQDSKIIALEARLAKLELLLNVQASKKPVRKTRR